MKTIVVTNNKGGVAKTTTTATVATMLADTKKRMLLIDADSQRNLGQLFGVAENDNNLSALFDGVAVVPTPIEPRIDIVTASNDLAGITHSNLKALQTWLDAQNYDYCIIDTPPSLSHVTADCLGVADVAIITTQAEPFALFGLQQIIDVIARVQTYNTKLTIGGVLVTKYTKRNVTDCALQALQSKFGKLIFSATIRDAISVVESTLNNTTVTRYAPKSKVADDYKQFFKELQKKLK